MRQFKDVLNDLQSKMKKNAHALGKDVKNRTTSSVI